MTDAELASEAEWMTQYVAKEWHGCKPYSRFARSLPEVLRRCAGILREEKPRAGREEEKNDGADAVPVR